LVNRKINDFLRNIHMKNAAVVGFVGSILLLLASVLWLVNGLLEGWLLDSYVLKVIPSVFVHIIALVGNVLLVLFFGLLLGKKP